MCAKIGGNIADPQWTVQGPARVIPDRGRGGTPCKPTDQFCMLTQKFFRGLIVHVVQGKEKIRYGNRVIGFYA